MSSIAFFKLTKPYYLLLHLQLQHLQDVVQAKTLVKAMIQRLKQSHRAKRKIHQKMQHLERQMMASMLM